MKNFLSIILFAVLFQPFVFKAKSTVPPKLSILKLVSTQDQKFTKLFYELGVQSIKIGENEFVFETHKDFVFHNAFYNF